MNDQQFSESAVENLLRVMELVKQIESYSEEFVSKQFMYHFRWYTDGSGGLFTYSLQDMDFVELCDWDSLPEAVVKLKQYVKNPTLFH